MRELPDTPHINPGGAPIAQTVLMPGDPLRAKKIAEDYLQDVKQFNQVRAMYGFTGTYKGKRISVMGSGMGLGSIGIYSYELYKFYDVNTIIRIGSCGAMVPELDIMDIILTEKAYSSETFAKEAHGYDEKLIAGSQRIFDIIKKVSTEKGIKVHAGNAASGNVFYSTLQDWGEIDKQYNVIAAEMEAFALFANAKALNKEAACLLTVSDSTFKEHQNLSADARQNAFDDMMLLALEAAAASLT